MGPAGMGNSYAQRLERWLDPFSDHEAVAIAEEMVNRGFTYDTPFAFALILGPLPDLALDSPPPSWMAARAGGDDILLRFRRALRDLAEKSRFSDFLHDNRELFDNLVAQSSEGYDPQRISGWMESFYGYGADGYHTVLAPASFPTGGYGVGITSGNGEWHLYNIARASESGPGTPILPGGRDLEMLAIHEWGHSLADPAVFAHPDSIRQLEDLYEPVSHLMAEQHYASLQSFAQEQVLRGIDAFARLEIWGDAEYQNYVSQMNSRGFYLTAMVAQELASYSDNRSEYETFADFAPVLLERMAREEPRPPRPRMRVHPALLVRAILGVVAAVVVFWWITVGMRRRRKQIEEMHDLDDSDSFSGS